MSDRQPPHPQIPCLATEDALAPARGCFFALLIGSLIWLPVLIALRWALVAH